MSGKKFLAGLTAFLAVMLMTTAAMAAPSLKYESEYDRDRFNVNNNTLIMVSGETVDTTITVTSGDDWPSGADDLYEITIQRKSESYQGHSYNLENLLITLHDNIDTRISSIDVRGTAGSVETENFTIFGYGATGYIPGTTGTEIASRDLILKIVSADSYYAAISPATIEIQENHSGTTSADVKVYCESYASGSKEITDVTDGFRILSMSIEPGTWNDLTLTASPADRQIGVSGRPSAIGVTESFTLEINASSGDLTVPFIVRTTTGRPWDGEITNIEISQDMYSVPVGVRFMKTIAFTTTPAVDSLSDVGYSAALSQSQWNNLQLEVDPAYNFVLVSGVPRAAATGQSFTLTASRPDKAPVTDSFRIEAVQPDASGSNLRPQSETVIADKDGRKRQSMTIGESNTLLFPLNSSVSDMIVTFVDSRGNEGYLIDVTELGFDRAINARRAFGEGMFAVVGNTVQVRFTPGLAGTHRFNFYYTMPLNGAFYSESRSAHSDYRPEGGDGDNGGGCAAGSGLAGVIALTAFAVMRRRG